VELHAGELRSVGEVDKVDTGRPHAVAGAHPVQEGAGPAADVEQLAAGAERDVPADDRLLLAVVALHRAAVKRRQDPPV